MNKISIIIPVYNVEKYLSTCLDSVINQTYQNLEIILVNDGSTDACPKICEEYAAKDNRIKVIHKQNGGLSDARNTGYQMATGEYIAFVDGDDVIALDLYKILYEKSILHNADIVECSFVKFSDEKDLKNFVLESSEEIELEAEKALELLLKEKLKQVVWNKIYKKRIINNFPFKKGKIHEDEFWTYRIFARAKKIVKINTPLYFYRQQNNSIMAEKYSIKRLDGVEAREERIAFIEKEFPSLTNLAVQSFWHSALYNYLLIVENPDVDVDFKFRKSIVKKIKEQVKPNYSAHWNIKERIWLTFFFANPRVCSKLRIFLRDWGLKNSN